MEKPSPGSLAAPVWEIRANRVPAVGHPGDTRPIATDEPPCILGRPSGPVMMGGNRWEEASDVRGAAWPGWAAIGDRRMGPGPGGGPRWARGAGRGARAPRARGIHRDDPRVGGPLRDGRDPRGDVRAREPGQRAGP